jgi:serine protease inhibitor
VHRRIRPVLALAAVALAAGCSEGPITRPITRLPRELTASETHLVAVTNEFAFRLFREMAREEGPAKNLFISPLSVGMALGMTYNGAAGTTQEAMQAVLGLEGMSLSEIDQAYRGVIALLRGLDPRVDFTLANSIWYRQDYSFEQPFLDTTRVYFDAAVEGLDFAAPSAGPTINGWVNDQTRGKITSIVPDPIPSDIVMYLINAVYFKGDWVVQFDRSRTAPAPFTLADRSTTSVPMMSFKAPGDVRVGGALYPQLGGSGPLLLDLRYGGGAYSMTIVMPGSPAGMDSLVSGLTRQQWDAWIAVLDSTEAFVSMPKFTLAYQLKLNDVLAALGMGVAFVGCPAVSDCADFTRMRSIRDLYISEVMHKTYVDVNEEGTEAAAATSVGMGTTSAPTSVVVDRPFLFAIWERFSGTILFMGRIMNPAATPG